MSDQGEITVGHGPRRDLLSVAVIYPAAVAALLGVGSVLSENFWRSLGVLGFITVVLSILVLVVFSQLASGTEQVRLTLSGVTCRSRFLGTPVLFERQEVQWERLEGIPRGRIRLGFVTFRWHKLGGYLNWFQLSVTPAQARAILLHPSCPKRPIPTETVRRLGLPESFGVASASN